MSAVYLLELIGGLWIVRILVRVELQRQFPGQKIGGKDNEIQMQSPYPCGNYVREVAEG